MKKWYCLIFLFLFVTNTGYSQYLESAMYHLSSEDGLPDMQVYRMVEDHNHYLWLATNSGTYRYDGKNFKLYRHKDQKGISTFGIVQDSKGSIWYNNGHGQIFSIKEDRVDLLLELDRKPLSYIENINVINDYIYVNGAEKIVVFDAKDYSYQEYHYGKERLPATDVIKTSTGVQVLKGEFLFQIGNDKKLQQTVDLSTLLEHRTRGFLIQEIGQLLIMLPDNKGNSFYDSKTIKRVDSAFKEVQQSTINFYKKVGDKHWFLTSIGAFEYTYKDGDFELINKYLNNFTLTDVVCDYYGNLIFSTLNSGLFIIPDKDVKVLSFDSRFTVRSVHSLINDASGNVYFITDRSRLHRFDKIKNKVTTIEIPRHQNQLLYYDTLTHKLILFNRSTISVLDENLSVVERFYNAETPKDLVRVTDSTYLAAFYNRTILFNNEFKEVKALNVRSLNTCVSDKGNLFYSSINGLQIADSTLETTAPVFNYGSHIMSGKIINQPEEDGVWTFVGNKIFQINDDKVVENDFVLPDIIQQIHDITSISKMLFVATDNGIYSIQTETNEVLKYSNTIINRKNITSINAAHDQLWITDGLKVYAIETDFKSSISGNEIDLYIKNIQVNGVDVFEDVIEVKFNESVRVDLWINRFKSASRYKYLYTFDEYGKWEELPKGNNSIVLNGIATGEQTLFIQAIDIVTGEESIMKEVYFNVEQPYYLKWWFYAIVLLSIVLATSGVFLINAQIKKNKWQKTLDLAQKERKMAQLQLENLRSQMNPHFLFNALNSLQDHIISNEKKEASKFLVKFSRLVRMYLDHSQYDKISLKQEVEALTLYLFLENKRFNNKLKYTIEIDEQIESLEIKVPSLFIQPYIENALVHGLLHKEGEKKLNVFFKRDQENLVCTIIDNGIGRKRAAQLNTTSNHKSFATQANANRIQLINTQEAADLSVVHLDITDQDQNVLGTKVIISLKYEIENTDH